MTLQSNGNGRGYASIMVVVDAGCEAEARIRLAGSLADRFCASLIGVAAQDVIPPLYFTSPLEEEVERFEINDAFIARELEHLKCMFKKTAGLRNQAEWREGKFPALDFACEQARAADLAVVSRQGSSDPVPVGMGLDPGDLVMGLGRAMLLVPPGIDYVSGKRIIVAWKNTTEARRAVRESLPLLVRAEQVFVVAVGDHRSADGADDVSAYLNLHGATSTPIKLPNEEALATDELLRAASEEGADLLVCGAYGHSRMREWAFGGVTRELLDRAPICCLMAH
jgi:nucleotide-binding universal stress UspA family protein